MLTLPINGVLHTYEMGGEVRNHINQFSQLNPILCMGGIYAPLILPNQYFYRSIHRRRGGATKMALISSLYPQYNYDDYQYKIMLNISTRLNYYYVAANFICLYIFLFYWIIFFCFYYFSN